MPDPTKTVPKPAKASVNTRLSPCRASTLRLLLGEPRAFYDQECRPMTNTKIKRLIVTEDVGPFRVTGLQPVVKRLHKALAQLRRLHPDVYDSLGSAGMLCCRYVRGSTKTVSNHAWGTAIDFTLDGKLDAYGDDRTQLGLFKVYSVLKDFGFYWGVSFGKEDSMHFEAADETIRAMAKAGEFA